MKAILFDGLKKLTLTLPPETISWDITGTYATNNILDVANPLVRPNYSTSTYKLSRILLISNGLKQDQYPTLNTLSIWAKKQTRLKFTYNTFVLDSCYIQDMSVNIKQWDKGRPVHVELDMSLLETAKLLTPEVGVKTKQITAREQLKYKTNIRVLLKPLAKRQLLGISDNYLVEVTDLSIVQIEDKGVTKEYEYDTLVKKLQ